jgi:N-acetylmuramoyl-L-alanine amidase
MARFAADSSLVTRIAPSPSHGVRKGVVRPDMIVLHYTGLADGEAALELLCSAQSELSAHYVVMEDGQLVQCVAEARRAWHAGASMWAGKADLNSCSIGIEVANPGHDFGYPDFTAPQIEAVIALCRDLMARHHIPPDRVLAHSDVAPTRKKDPGEKFPWRQLHERSVGHWVEPAPVAEGGPVLGPGDCTPAVRKLQVTLAAYGYGIPVTGSYDALTKDVVAAFQRHFRPARVDGVADASTAETLDALHAARIRRT